MGGSLWNPCLITMFKIDLKDAPSRTSASTTYVATVDNLFQQDARLTFKDVADSVGMASGTVHKIFFFFITIHLVYLTKKKTEKNM